MLETGLVRGKNAHITGTCAISLNSHITVLSVDKVVEDSGDVSQTTSGRLGYKATGKWEVGCRERSQRESSRRRNGSEEGRAKEGTETDRAQVHTDLRRLNRGISKKAKSH